MKVLVFLMAVGILAGAAEPAELELARIRQSIMDLEARLTENDDVLKEEIAVLKRQLEKAPISLAKSAPKSVLKTVSKSARVISWNPSKESFSYADGWDAPDKFIFSYCRIGYYPETKSGRPERYNCLGVYVRRVTQVEDEVVRTLGKKDGECLQSAGCILLPDSERQCWTEAFAQFTPIVTIQAERFCQGLVR